MGSTKAISILLVLTALAGGEAAVFWRLGRDSVQATNGIRIASLEIKLTETLRENSKLIMLLDAESRKAASERRMAALESKTLESRALESRALESRALESKTLESRSIASKSLDSKTFESKTFWPKTSDPKTADSKNFETQMFGSQVGQPPMSAEAELAAATLKPVGKASDIDLPHLVNMSNIMSGEKVAELVKDGDHEAIQFSGHQLDEDSPLWTVLTAIHDAGILGKIELFEKSSNQELRNDLKHGLVRFGIPSSVIKAATQGLNGRKEGVLITLNKLAMDRGRR